ncbi:MAG: hypothetical protein R8K20_09885, partial [Gallionellaceae bacterium]
MGGKSKVSLSASDRQEIVNGQAAINRRRAEFAFMANGSRTQSSKPQSPALAQPPQAPETAPENQYPYRVTFYTAMGIDAARRCSGVGGAWRLYVLAKALDRQGLGKIPRAELRAFALDLGLNPRTYQRWIDQAERRGVLSFYKIKSGEWWVNLQSPGKLC